MSEKRAKFQLKEYKIYSANIEFDPLKEPKNMAVEIIRTGEEKDDLYESHLEVNVKDKENNFKVNAKLVAYFKFDSDIDEGMKNTFFNVSAPAILFPYIRAYISTLTSLSGLKAVIIPTINLAEIPTK